LLKKTITYTNPFTEEEVTEDFYFHISKADLVEMEVENHAASYTNKAGEKLTGMQAHLQRMVDSEDAPSVMKEFKAILRRAYGKKVGERFVKTAEVWSEFEGSDAYSELLFDLLSNPEKSAEFMSGIFPKNLDKEVEKLSAEVEAAKAAAGAEPAAETPALAKASTALATEEDPTGLTNPGTPQILTPAEVAEMDSDELKSGLATGRYKLA
jgi:hypothetical protein